MSHPVELITYADRLAPDLAGLADLLGGPLAGLFGGVHLLPFFVPIDGADAGFDPDDQRRVDPRIGSWADIERLAQRHAVTADLIVNHISARSEPFLDYLASGERSPHADMFLTLDRVFPDGADEQALLAIYRPRPGLPFTARRFGDGRRRLLWTTFTGDQIDLDVESRGAIEYLHGILDTFRTHGVTTVRLDAVGYAVKRAGTSCFMLPETFAFVERLGGWVHDRGMDVLVEVHAHHRRQLEIAAAGRLDLRLRASPARVARTVHRRRRAAGRVVGRPAPQLHHGARHARRDRRGRRRCRRRSRRGRQDSSTPTRSTRCVEQIHDPQRAAPAARRPGPPPAISTSTRSIAPSTMRSAVTTPATSSPGSSSCSSPDGRSSTTSVSSPARTTPSSSPPPVSAATSTGTATTPPRSRPTVQRPLVRALFAAIRIRSDHPAFDGDFTWHVSERSRLAPALGRRRRRRGRAGGRHGRRPPSPWSSPTPRDPAAYASVAELAAVEEQAR